MEVIRYGTTEATIDPQHGGTVVAWSVSGRQAIFPESEYRINGVMKLRGGIPILFPVAGSLTVQPEGWHLSQHGFARDMSWEIVKRYGDSLVLSLSSTDATRAMYPFDFHCTLTIKVGNGSLEYLFTVHNTGTEPMPMAPGFHPYFYVPLVQKPAITTNIKGFEPATFSWNETLVFKAPSPVILTVPQYGTTEITASKEYASTIIWSEPERDQLCIEPWAGPPEYLTDAGQKAQVAPGSTWKSTLALKFEPAWDAHVVRGHGRGKKLLGFPTINLLIPQDFGCEHGIYACRVWLEGTSYLGAMHFGPIPAFDNDEPSLEIFILDYDADTAVEYVTVKPLEHLRAIRDFDSLEALHDQIAKDVEQVRSLYAS